jgi:hypothetical protein
VIVRACCIAGAKLLFPVATPRGSSRRTMVAVRSSLFALGCLCIPYWCEKNARMCYVCFACSFEHLGRALTVFSRAQQLLVSTTRGTIFLSLRSFLWTHQLTLKTTPNLIFITVSTVNLHNNLTQPIVFSTSRYTILPLSEVLGQLGNPPPHPPHRSGASTH